MNKEKIHLYCEKEERLNTISHGISTIIALVMLVFMIIGVYGKSQIIVGAMVFYSASTLLVYLCSTIYHGMKNIDKKIVAQKVDHAMVSLIIAGTAVPALLVTSDGTGAKIMLGLVLTATVINIVVNAISVHKYKKISQILYALGLLLIAVGMSVDAIALDNGFWALFLIGLAVIITGGVFYMQKSKKYTHFVWHIADITCSVLHFLAFYIYIVL